MDIDACIDVLTQAQVALDTGYADHELTRIEERFDIRFSPDHRALLGAVQPRGAGWVHWRDDSEVDLRSSLGWPLEGILFDVEHNTFWPRVWGPRPDGTEQSRAIATEHLRAWPVLLPLYRHRYMPAAPAGPGAPVFSVHQTDVIFYGADLLDYLTHEFGHHRTAAKRGAADDATTCPPWSQLAYGDDPTL